MTRILVIEDDLETAEEIAACLTAGGFEAVKRFDGPAGLEAATTETFDAITLDRMLPGLDGLELVKALRDAGSEAPVLMVSALSDVDDRVDGLRAGGDDYLIKPFSPKELVARLEVLLRRHRRTGRGGAPAGRRPGARSGQARGAARRADDRAAARREFQLLEFMMLNAGQLLTRRMIFEKVWEYYFDPGTNLINVHVGKLRRKIDLPGLTPLIRTERGLGYMLHAP